MVWHESVTSPKVNSGVSPFMVMRNVGQWCRPRVKAEVFLPQPHDISP